MRGTTPILSRAARTVTVIAAAATTLILTTCTNPMLTTLEAVVTGYQQPTASVSFSTGSGIAGNTAIVVTFSETMDPSTLELGGTLATWADGGTWSEGTVPDDTLTIGPVSSWPAGSGKTLTVDCTDLDTYEMETLTATYGILEGIVYVSTDGGSDLNPGTSDQPTASIARAVGMAEAVYETAEVRVAGGTYEITAPVAITKNISLYGGYNPANWLDRNSTDYQTLMKDLVTGTHEVVSYGDGVASSAVLDGFRIEVGGTSTSEANVAVFVSGGSPTIRNNTIVTGIASRAYGVVATSADIEIRNNTFLTSDLLGIVSCVNASDSTVVIADNTFTGGLITQFYGLLLESSQSVIERNVINAGQPISQAQCVSLDGGAATIRNNVITAGNIPASDDVIGQYGIYLNSCTATIQNNTIDGGTGFSTDGIMTTAIMLFYQVTSTIENNIIFTMGGDLRTGVWQKDAASFPAAFNNNVMFGCPDGNYYDEPNNYAYAGAPGHDRVDLETYLSSIAATGNVFETSGDLTAPPEYRPQATSPSSIRSGGKDLSAFFTDDIEGATRSAPWSVGAYEY